MKKTYSLIKACMTSDMNLFKLKTKNKKSSKLVPLFIALYLMFMIWGSANSMFEKLAPTHMQYILLSLFAFSISILTIMEGIYKAGPLIFNCKDDDLLLSLPIKRKTILFIRILKFYIFELLYNSLFLLPIMIAYIRWAENITWTYFLTSIIMLLFLPIIPIILSCILGAITSSLTSRFKYKNAAQIILSMILLVGILLISFNSENIMNYLIKHANGINDLIIKIYYPAGIYAKLITNFNIKELLLFIIINIVILTLSIYILSKFYFKINSRLKKITTSKKTKINNLIIKQRSKTYSLIKKELNTFFKTPVFIINSGFALVLFILTAIIITYKFDSIIPILTSKEGGLGLSKELLNNNISILILVLISLTAYMTSITNSVISLEGKNINILKSLPIKIKTILMSKIYSCLIITTPVLLIGNIILFIKFKINILESLLLIVLSILIPLVSHFIGIIVNLKYPKLDAENSAEVVKQSTSSFISVMIGMILALLSIVIITKIIGKINSSIFLIIVTIIYIIINTILYLYLIKKGTIEFNKLTV
ncbi:MAG: hypothetical protein IJI49_01360 [Bacilli bacterium]|nr:hypothetical protein [Bacilli bacterium]